jgi:hypothetical protein
MKGAAEETRGCGKLLGYVDHEAVHCVRHENGECHALETASPAPPSPEARPRVHKGMTCGRCGATDCIIVPNVDPTFRKLQGVGLTQHAVLCPEVCAGRWSCGACDDDGLTRTDQHARDCEVTRPEVRAEWEKKNDHATMRLAAMVAARGEFLPAFIMDALFPGFEHADPPSFASFKAAATP